MFIRQQRIVVVLISFTLIVGLHADTLSKLVGVLQTDSSGESYQISNFEPPEHVDGSDLTPTGPIEAVTATFPKTVVTTSAVDIGDGSFSKVYSMARGESTGSGPGPGNDASEGGTLFMALVALSVFSALHTFRKQCGYRL